MCRILRPGLAPALALALVLVPSAAAAPVLTLRSDGSTYVREDRFLPPAGRAVAPGSARTRRAAAASGSPARRAAGARARAAARKPSVRGELRRMLLAGAINRSTHDDRRATYADALRLRRKLKGARRQALGAVLRNLEEIAGSGLLTVSRLPALFETVERNREWWARGPLLGSGARVGFQGSKLVWQHYPGEGLQIQWLGTFGKANGLWQGGYTASLRTLVGEALALAAQRAGGIAWEYLFRFDGGRPPWVSGLAQGTAVQALARAGVKLGDPASLDAARAGLGVFRQAPPSGVRIATPAGAHYLIYSFAPGLRVLNAFTQALNGLHDYAALTGDAEGGALFAAGDAQLRAELPRYDTGAWSRYSTSRVADLHYHRLARDFLRNLCTRLAPATTATPGGGTPALATVAAPADPAPYCDAAQRWTRYLAEPPRIELRSRRVRGGRSASVRFTLSKPSYVTLRLRRGGRTVVVLRDRFAGGRGSLRWRRPPRRAGRYRVELRATDLAGNAGASTATLRVLKARAEKRRAARG